jgi:hypothetical protein
MLLKTTAPSPPRGLAVAAALDGILIVDYGTLAASKLGVTVKNEGREVP